ncbi:class I tRNA ligase family protein, partial [Candidatus Woesearchaeota archaeon]|nr:class I tRNA ligase family protein [Candidatus Woesearchaeota archaeon]
HCWRCHNPVIFRTTVQWFFRIEDLKPKMIEYNEKIVWAGDAGKSAFDSWLRNLRDNSITKQRFWGTPLPVWKCQHCNAYDVIGSRAELETKANVKLSDLHKPWIDEVTIPCACGGQRTRIPDIMDVWLDAGTNSWTCLDFPQRDDLFNKMFPADFICEGKDQIRGWFYVMMICGVLGFGKPSFKRVYMHGYVNDALGRKMSKSLGNYIVPEEVIGSFGADTFRYYFIGSAPPGVDCSYNQEDVKPKFRSLGVLWNLHKYLIELAVTHGYCATDLEALKLDPKKLGVEERYILSKCHSSIQHLTELYDTYLLNQTPGVVEELFLELSRTYIQLVREKLATGEDDEKKESAAVIYHVLRNVLAMFAPTAPFITEAMYQDLKKVFSLNEESIHLQSWPTAEKRFIDAELEGTMSIAGSVMTSILAAREKALLTVRWPIREVTVVTRNDDVTAAIEGLSELIKTQTNIKELFVRSSMEGVVTSCRIDPGKLGGDFGPLTPKILLAFGNEDPKKVLAGIEADAQYTLKIDSQQVKLTTKHIITDRTVPPNLVEVEVKGGFIYLDKTRTPELNAEGYSRELMRRIQAFRKTQGLEKRDRVKLHVKVSASLLTLFGQYEDAIAEKCGASDITLASTDPTTTYAWQATENIKDETFGVWMEKRI